MSQKDMLPQRLFPTHAGMLQPREDLRKGTAAPPFLARMAKETRRPKSSARIPMPDRVTTESRKEDEVPW